MPILQITLSQISGKIHVGTSRFGVSSCASRGKRLQMAFLVGGGGDMALGMQDRFPDNDAILAEFRAAKALLEGHFILSSGLHSSHYLQCARVLMDPARAARLIDALAARLPQTVRAEARAVVAPAMGGIICGHELARALGLEFLFVERPEGVFEFRRGFELAPDTPVILMEDVVTTGLSSREAKAAIEQAGGRVIHAACLVDRSGGVADLGVPLTSLLQLNVPSHAPDALPPELAAIPAVRPGSRKSDVRQSDNRAAS